MASDVDKALDLRFGDGLVPVGPYGAATPQKMFAMGRRQLQVHLKRGALVGPHGLVVETATGTNRHTVAAANAGLLPPWNGYWVTVRRQVDDA